MNQVELIIQKNFIRLISLLSWLFIIFGIPFLIYTFFWTPNAKKARDLIRSTSGYYPPIYTKLLYSKNYWESLNTKEPRSMCFVFQYSQKDLIAFQNHKFLNTKIDEEKIWSSSSPIPRNRGCAKFRATLNPVDLLLFNKHFEYLRNLQGASIFVNENDRLVMFEIYLFD